MRDTSFFVRSAAGAAVVFLAAQAARAQTPVTAASSAPDAVAPGWHVGSASPSLVRLTLDSTVAHGGRASGRLDVPTGSAPDVAASLNQLIQADAYRGQRVRLSGWVRTRDAASVASWVRVEGATRDTLVALALSSGADHPIAGSAEWQHVEHVVDVAPTARAIAFGVLLRGGGTVWLDDFALTPVDRATPSTNRLAMPAAIRETPDEQRRIRASWATLPAHPLNLDFEHPLASGQR